MRQVVGYARAAGLYCIINVHHDGADGWKGVGWLSLKDASGNTTDRNNAKVREQFVTVWTQVAKHFANHGEELLFESMNEIHDGYGKPDPRHYAIINDLNQKFVDVVRASGANNARRHLLVPGYNTNINQTIEGFKLPSDPTKGRLHPVGALLRSLPVRAGKARRTPGATLRPAGTTGVRRTSSSPSSTSSRPTMSTRACP